MSLSRSAILNVNDTKLDKVNVPEWGGDVCIKTLTGTERDIFEDSYADQKMKQFRVRFLVLTLCDESGNRLFTNEEIDVIGSKSSTVIATLFDKAWAFNAFRTEDVNALGEGSPSDQSADSISN